MHAGQLLKRNIDAMLRARGQTRSDLAASCGLTRSWASRVFKEGGDGTRGIPLKYLDAFADFFGIATYQLFQPGISPLTERRSGTDRRSHQDRRISATRADGETPIRRVEVTPDDEAILADLHALSYENYQRVKGWITVARLGTGSARRTTPRAETPAATPAPPSRPTRRRTHGHLT
jgi:hypothetical protein